MHRNHHPGLTLRLVRRGLLFTALFTCFAPLCRSQENLIPPEVVTKVAVAIQKAAKHDKVASVLVLDFADERGFRSELGVRLADEFASSLAKQSPAITVTDREALRAALLRDKVPPDTLEQANIERCYPKEFDVSFYIDGKLRLTASQYLLTLRVVTSKSDFSGGLPGRGFA
jgi:hypothetical protein